MLDIRAALEKLGWDETTINFFLDRAHELPNQVCYLANTPTSNMPIVDVKNLTVTNNPS